VALFACLVLHAAGVLEQVWSSLVHIVLWLLLNCRAF
jgi:hypothetical protein